MTRPKFVPLVEIAAMVGREVSYLRSIAWEQQRLQAGRRTSLAPHLLQSYPAFTKVVSNWGVWDDELQAWLNKHKG